MQQDKEPGGAGGNAGRLLLPAILVIAAFLRFYGLDRTSLWYDEAVSWDQSRGSFAALLSSVAMDNYPPLHNILLWLTMPVAGDNEFALRLPSAVLGVLAVWLIYLTGRALVGETQGGKFAGLLAAALLAVSPFHIWYSTEARMYALLAASGLAFLLSVLKVLKHPSGGWLLALSVGGAAFLYSHIYALLGFATVGLVCALFVLGDLARTGRLQKSNALAACLAMGVSVLAFLPWLIILANRARSVADAGFWIAYPDLPFLKSMAFSITGSLVLFWMLAGLALIFCLGTYLDRATPLPAAGTNRRTATVVLAYTAGPLLLAYLYSVLVQPILFDRYLIAAWPGLLLLAAAGANRLAPRFGPIALIAVALALTFPELKFTLTNKIRPEWREIVEAYQANRAPGDSLVLYKGFAAPALAYYLRQPDSFQAPETVEDLKDLPLPSSGQRWLLLVHSGPEDMDEALEAFGAVDPEPVAQRFGWGASGLRLLRAQTPD